MDLVQREILGSKMYLLRDDPGISRELLKHGIREKGAVKIVHRVVKPGMFVIDIGANLGYYALMESRLVGPEGKVYAIEPVEKNHEVLCKNVQINKYRNVETFNLAIGDENSNREILLSVNSNHATMMDMGQASGYYKSRMERIGGDTINVPTVTLDRFVEENNIDRVDFIRMDVEGFEIEIVKGMQRTIERFGPKILVELHYVHFERPAVINDMIVDMLKSGYEIVDMANRRGRVAINGLKDKTIRRSCPHVLFSKRESSSIHILADMPSFNVGSGAHQAMYALLDGLKARGFEVEILKKPWVRNIVKSLYQWADIIFTQGSQVTRVRTLARGKPIAYYIHNDYRIATIEPLYKLSELDIDLLIFNAEWVKQRSPWSKDNIIVHPAVNAEKFRTTPGDCITLVNLNQKKGGRIFRKIAEKMPDRKFLGVKGGWGIQLIPVLDNVEVIPKTLNIRNDVYARTRILLMPSQYLGPTEPWNWTESWGMVGIEAMCSGIPVIAHPTPGLEESLGYAGIFIDRENIDGWVEAIKRLDDPEVYRKQSELALKRVTELDPDPQLDALAEMIRQRIWNWKYLG